MAAEEATLRGYVIGEEGRPVAGWVSLGLDQPQRWLARSVRIETDDGYEVTIEELAGDSIVPVTKLEVPWGQIEQDEVAQLCYREAPSPETDVEFRDAILRGGDPVVVWGEVADHGYAGGEDTQSPAYTGGGARQITRLQARVVAYGENCEAFFTDARARWLAKHVEKPLAKIATKAPEPLPVAPTADRNYHNRLHWNLPLYLAVTIIGALAIVAIGTRRPVPMLLAISTAAYLPLVFDAQLLPRFRRGAVAPPPLEIPFIAYMLTAIGTTLFAYGTATSDAAPHKSSGVYVFTYVFAFIALGAAAWMWIATRTRRSYISTMLRAPKHLDPLRDGVWGASDGAFSSEVMSIGETINVVQRSRRRTKYANLGYQEDLVTDGERKVRRVRLAEASILTMVRFDRAVGKDEGVRADVITPRTPVRMVGKSQNGTFVKTGEASLLVFAAGIGTDVGKELRKLWLRDWIAQGLAILGVACLVLALLL